MQTIGSADSKPQPDGPAVLMSLAAILFTAAETASETQRTIWLLRQALGYLESRYAHQLAGEREARAAVAAGGGKPPPRKRGRKPKPRLTKAETTAPMFTEPPAEAA